LLAIIGPLNQIYIPTTFIVPGDATATARNIMAGELTYRIGIFSGLVSHVLFLFVVMSLYRLLKDVDRSQARLMVVLVAVGVAVGVANLFNQIAPLVLLSGADYLSVFTKPQLDALALSFLRVRGGGNYVDMMFWAIWLFPFGILVIKSRFLPRVIGFLLIVGGFAYMSLSLIGIVLPAHRQMATQALLPFYAVGEVSIILWLLIKGVREQTRLAETQGRA